MIAMTLKHASVACFVDGQLMVKRSGYGAADGWATLSIPEDQIEWIEGKAIVEIPPSELRALRDFIDAELARATAAA